jgi:hypothetical protein
MKYPRGYKVMDADGREYSKAPLTKRRAEAQMRALQAAEAAGRFHQGPGYSHYEHRGKQYTLLHGAGWFGDIMTKIKVAAAKGRDFVLRKAADLTSKPIRLNYPPKARATLAKWGDGVVEELLIRRAPIQSFVNKALNFMTAGRWDEVRSRIGYDTLFHLSMVARVRKPNGAVGAVIIEKNEVINISDSFKTSGTEEYKPVPVPCCITLQAMMDKAAQRAGPDFFRYDAFTNNCQMFLDGILTANGLQTPEVKGFILQDVGQLLSQMPGFLAPVARLTTNLAGIADRVIEGEGKSTGCCGACSAPLRGDCGSRGGCGECGSARGAGFFPMARMMHLQQQRVAADPVYQANLQRQREEFERANPYKCPMVYAATTATLPGDATRMVEGLRVSNKYTSPSSIPCDQFFAQKKDEDRLYDKSRQGFWGNFWDGFKSVLGPVADVLSFIPGPIGTVANVVSSGLDMFGDGKPGPSKKLLAYFKRVKVDPAAYLRTARRFAKAHGIDPKTVRLSTDGAHKLEVATPSGIKRIGAISYQDFIVYKLRGNALAAKKRDLYLRRAAAAGGDWRNDPYSDNNLALKILWNA